MAQLTYLQIVNKVLARLREDTVTSVDYNTYSALIGEFVNDAKREVEDAWSWTHNKHTISFVTATSTSIYDISQNTSLVTSGTLTNSRSRLAYDPCGLPVAYDVTTSDAYQLYELSHDEIIRSYALDNGANEDPATPNKFALRRIPGEGDGFSIAFDQYPYTSRTYQFTFYTPQADMEDDIDVLEIPWQPVRDLALLYALDERGEEIGEPGSKAWLRYEKSLGDLIALDSVNSAHKITFKVV